MSSFSLYSARSATRNVYDLETTELAPVEDICTLTINYFLRDTGYVDLEGKIPTQPYIATLLKGSSYEVKSPSVTGFIAVPDTVSGILEEDTIVDVFYEPTDRNYTVNHYYERLDSGFDK